MILGDKSSWWNRSLPMKRIGLLIAILAVAGCGYLYLSPVLNAIIWAIEHQSTANFKGLEVKVPWLWKPEDAPSGQQELRLVRARFGQAFSMESIVIIYDAVPPVADKTMTERFQIVASGLGEPNFRGELLPVDDVVAELYSCIAPHLTKLLDWRVSCESTDGHWRVNLTGPERDKQDLIKILHSLSSEQHNKGSKL